MKRNLKRLSIIALLVLTFNMTLSFGVLTIDPTGVATVQAAATNPYPRGGECKNGKNCTAYVWDQWHNLGVDLPGTPGDNWGNAASWEEQARKHGFLVGDVPAKDAIAVFQEGSYATSDAGHVAIVREVEGNQATLEQENCYIGNRTVSHINWTDSRLRVKFIYFPGRTGKEEALLIRQTDGDGRVWGVHSGARYWIPNPQTLEQRYSKAAWGRIIGVSANVLNSIPEMPSRTNVSSIVSDQANKCLDVSGVSSRNGADVHLWDCFDIPNQKWLFIPVPGKDNTYYIVASHSYKCLDVLGASLSDGASIIQWDCGGGLNQQWRFVSWAGQAGSGLMLQAVHSNKCISIGGNGNGQSAVQWGCSGWYNETWQFLDLKSA